jgi:hypothetical protein
LALATAWILAATDGNGGGWTYVLALVIGSPLLVKIADYFRGRQWTIQRELGAMRERIESLEREVKELRDRYDRRGEELVAARIENMQLKLEVDGLLVELGRPLRYTTQLYTPIALEKPS